MLLGQLAGRLDRSEGFSVFSEDLQTWSFVVHALNSELRFLPVRCIQDVVEIGYRSGNVSTAKLGDSIAEPNIQNVAHVQLLVQCGRKLEHEALKYFRW